MNYTVHHPRLQMYYDSAAMNIASLGAALSLVILSHYGFTILPVVALCIFFAFMVGYSIWFWVSKPKNVPTSNFLSNVSLYYILYALILGTLYPVSVGWCVLGLVAAIAILLIYIVKVK